MYIPSTCVISPAVLLRGLFAREHPHQGGNISYFSHARFALRELVNTLMHRGINSIWLPSFICRETVEPLKTTGVAINFYRILRDLSPDFKDISNKIKQRSAFVLVHYFGFPNDVDGALAFCRDNNLFLIEDCAQVGGTKHAGALLGSFGDASIFSPRKYLPVPEGAFLLINDETIQKPTFNGKDTHITVTPILKGLTKWLLLNTGCPVELWHRKRAITPGDEDLPPDDNLNETLHHYMEKLLLCLQRDMPAMQRKRQDNYSFLLRSSAALPSRPLFRSIADDVCPYAFPVHVDHRDKALVRLRRDGIGAQYWPNLPREVSGNPSFPMANSLRGSLLLLPIHQDLCRKHMEHIATSLESAIR